jgi:hypothetical protein
MIIQEIVEQPITIYISPKLNIRESCSQFTNLNRISKLYNDMRDGGREE